MSYQEKKVILSFVSNIVIFLVYYMLVLERYDPAMVDTPSFNKFWASVILLFIPVLALSKILIIILFNIFYRMIAKEVEPSFADELDKRIYLRAIASFCQVFMLGYALSMGSLILDFTPYVMFNMLLITSIVAGIAIDITQFYYYRKGI